MRKKSVILELFGLSLTPSASSISVNSARGGKLNPKTPIQRGPGGESVVTQAKNPFFKTMAVRRVLDEDRGALVYVSYTSRVFVDDVDSTSTSGSSAGGSRCGDFLF